MFFRTGVVKLIDYQKVFIVRRLHLISKTAYVNGKWVGAKNNDVFDVMNPADNTVFGQVPNMSVDDIQIAIDKAHKAFQTWQYTTAKERSQLLRKWYDLMTLKSEDLARLMTLESGKPIREARGEVAYGNSYVEWFSEEARRITGEIVPSPVKNKYMIHKKYPIGVTALITPWNFPHAMIARKAAAALAAGCTVVVKPSEDTPLTALGMAKLAHDAGIPKGVLNVVTCDRKHAVAVGKLLCTSPKIAGISFTGSTGVGKILNSLCAPGIKRVALELGGNAPFIVFPSANVDHAVKGAIASKFRNSGQACVASNRFLIHVSVFDDFVKKFKQEMTQFVLGYGLSEEVTNGPLINLGQAQKVDELVNDALSNNANLVIGGNKVADLGELFYQPTLLTGITPKMRIYSEEIFGPVAACIQFKDEEEAIKIANSTKAGLAAYFFSNDVSQIFRVASQLEVGMIGINEGLISSTEAAFGGIKESGIGREGSSHGVDDYMYTKYICLGNL